MTLIFMLPFQGKIEFCIYTQGVVLTGRCHWAEL